MNDDTLAELGEGHAPASFLCPVSQELMRDPVVCADGHSYERRHIVHWLEDHSTSPVSGAKLDQKGDSADVFHYSSRMCATNHSILINDNAN